MLFSLCGMLTDVHSLCQWCFLRTCWKKDWEPVTLPCWDWVTSSSQESSSLCCCALTSGNARRLYAVSTFFSRVRSAWIFSDWREKVRLVSSSSLRSLKKNSRTYFYSSFLAYIFGLGLTIFVMHTFKHAQVRLQVGRVSAPATRKQKIMNCLFTNKSRTNNSSRARLHTFELWLKTRYHSKLQYILTLSALFFQTLVLKVKR